MASDAPDPFDHLVSKRLLNSIMDGRQQLGLPPMDERKEAILYSTIYEIVKSSMKEMSDQAVASVLEIEETWT